MKSKTVGDLFPSGLAWVDRVTWYLLMVGGRRYLMELVEVREICPEHQEGNKNKNKIKNI